MGQIVESAHAKINLALDVGPVRPDGYHEIHTAMQSLELQDVVLLEERPQGISLNCLRGNPLSQGAQSCLELYTAPLPPSDDSNLAWQAAALLMETAGVRRGAYRNRKAIHRQPAWGGSADAAANAAGPKSAVEPGHGLPGAGCSRVKVALMSPSACWKGLQSGRYW